VGLVIKPGEQRFFSKRDASTFFDTLRAPTDIQTFFGQPGVTVLELLEASGWRCEILGSYVNDLDTEHLETDLIL